MEEINTRILRVIEELGLSKNQFAIAIGTSSAMISKITNQKINFGVDILEKIISKYPHLNQQWLLTGIGDIWLETHTQNTHLNAHLTGKKAKVSPEAQKMFDKLEAKQRPYREFYESTEAVPYNYIRKVDELLQVNNPELYKLSRDIDIILGFKDVIFALDEKQFNKIGNAFSRYKKGTFDIVEYEKSVTNALKELENYKPAFDKVVKAILAFYADLKQLGVDNIDLDAYIR